MGEQTAITAAVLRSSVTLMTEPLFDFHVRMSTVVSALRRGCEELT
jgi:hypothetical protein